MLTLLAVVHILIGLLLIMFVLLQDPKGGAMGVFSGGSSSSSFFGTSGASTFLTSATRWLAIAFAVSCLVLVYVTSRKQSSVMDTYVPPAATAPANADSTNPAPATAPTTTPDSAPPSPAPSEAPKQ